MFANAPVLKRLEALHPKSIDLSLGRIKRLLERLGSPQDKLPPAIHVAGTNGKGSVIAFLRAFLEAAGYRTHVLTSPHLVTFNERIRLAGCLITDRELESLIDECEQANGSDPITFFEITTAAAYLAFLRTPADVVLLETGLGGRLDATNVINKPALSVITPIAMDHQAYLGDTIEEIAREKAGIIKPGVPCLTASQCQAADRVIDQHSKNIGAPLIKEKRDWFATKTSDGFSFHMADRRKTSFSLPSLNGAHQIHNAGLAMACLEHLGDFRIPASAVESGLRTVSWPGRLQLLSKGPLADLLPKGWELWLDAGHNPSAAKVLARHISYWRTMPLHMVVGMMASRDPADFINPFSGGLASVEAIRIPGQENAHSPEALARSLESAGFKARAAGSIQEALCRIAQTQPGPGRVLVCGSVYLAGEVLGKSGKEVWPK